MNSDKVMYCNDLAGLKIRLAKDGYYDVESDTYSTPGNLTPIKYNGNTTLSYTRNCTLDLGEYIELEDLGTYDEVFADSAKDAKYKSVYDYTEKIEYTDEDGVVQSYYPSKKIAMFL